MLEGLDLVSFRIHDLRHTAASMWIAMGADVKVVQRILGHATATTTLDLYGHLWEAAKLLGHISVTRDAESQESGKSSETKDDR